MDRVTREEWKHIPSGRGVMQWQGGKVCRQAPPEPGLYTLYELVGPRNTHLGWRWERER